MQGSLTRASFDPRLVSESSAANTSHLAATLTPGTLHPFWTYGKRAEDTESQVRRTPVGLQFPQHPHVRVRLRELPGLGLRELVLPCLLVAAVDPFGLLARNCGFVVGVHGIYTDSSA